MCSAAAKVRVDTGLCVQGGVKTKRLGYGGGLEITLVVGTGKVCVCVWPSVWVCVSFLWQHSCLPACGSPAETLLVA